MKIENICCFKDGFLKVASTQNCWIHFAFLVARLIWNLGPKSTKVFLYGEIRNSKLRFVSEHNFFRTKVSSHIKLIRNSKVVFASEISKSSLFGVIFEKLYFFLFGVRSYKRSLGMATRFRQWVFRKVSSESNSLWRNFQRWRVAG